MTIAKIDYLLEQFLNRTLPIVEWTHEVHLIIALWFVKNHTVSEATCLIRARIITYNVAVGTPNSPTRGYHETITLFWIKLINKFIQQNNALEMEALAKYFLASRYAQQTVLFEYYTKELLFSTAARANWVPPNLKELAL